MPVAILQWLGRSWLGNYLGWVALLTVVFASLNPAASEGMSDGLVAVFWLVHIASALFVLNLAQLLVSRFGPLRPIGIVGEVVLAGLVGALAFTPIALGLDNVFPDMDGDGDPGAPLPVRLGSEFLSFIVPLSGTWLVVNAPKLIEAYKGQQPAAGADTQPELEASPVPETATSPFLEEMPPHLGKDLVALSAELHYLRIHTAVGEALVLYSFGKALDQLADWPGMQVHRSHWVGLDHVVDLEKDGERVFCVLDSGLRLPVSRPYRPRLRAALQDR